MLGILVRGVVRGQIAIVLAHIDAALRAPAPEDTAPPQTEHTTTIPV